MPEIEEESFLDQPNDDRHAVAALLAWRTHILNIFLLFVSIIAIPSLVLMIIGAGRIPGQWPIVLAIAGIYLIIVGLSIYRKLEFRRRAYGFLGMVYLAGILVLVRGGFEVAGREYLLVLPLIAVILVGELPGVWFALLSVVAMLAFPFFANAGLLKDWLNPDTLLSLGSWLVSDLSTILIMVVMLVLLIMYHRWQQKVLHEATQESNQVDDSHQELQSMVASMDILLMKVMDDAKGLGDASALLQKVAQQVSYAAAQIAETVPKVIVGIQQQTEAIQRTNESVEMVSLAAGGVAMGTQQQASAVSEASEIAASVFEKFQHIAENASGVQRDSRNASQIAETGMSTVEETIQGMQAIKSKVNEASLKVQEMGNRSTEINDIVETINDIASQTNLLALNAAIEAARAGVHGRGFAVVANEVRRLADRSSNATKEIGAIIKTILQSVSDAVIAINESAAEVETGVERANRSGNALVEIIEAVEGIYERAGRTVLAAQEMTVSSEKLAKTMDEVSNIVVENTNTSVQMTASAGEMADAMDQIACVSQENSAAMEQVAASSEEMRSGVEELVTSIQSLTSMSETLLELVSQFKARI